MAELVNESGAKEIDSYQDRKGMPVRLYRLRLGDGRDACALHMFNDTPELEDGHHKPYILRVPPTLRKAREAMSWTWGMDAQEYAPQAES